MWIQKSIFFIYLLNKFWKASRVQKLGLKSTSATIKIAPKNKVEKNRGFNLDFNSENY